MKAHVVWRYGTTHSPLWKYEIDVNGKLQAPTALTSVERVPCIHLLGHQMSPRVGLKKRENKRKEKRKEEENLFPFPGIEPQFLGLLGYSLDTIPITLWLHAYTRIQRENKPLHSLFICFKVSRQCQHNVWAETFYSRDTHHHQMAQNSRWSN